MAAPPQHGLEGGQLDGALAEAAMRVHERYVGGRAATAQALCRQRVVLVTMHDAMTRSERELMAEGRREGALELRRQTEQMMRDDLVEAVEELTGREVVEFITDCLPDSGSAETLFVAETFILDGPPAGEPGRARPFIAAPPATREPVRPESPPAA